MSRKDYYKLLNVDKKASEADIKTAFKKLAREYHPDVNPNDKVAEEKFKEISEAYEVLGDKKKRQQYDQMGTFNFGRSGPTDPHSQNYWQNVHFDDVDINDIFGDIFGFGGPKRGRRQGQVRYGFNQQQSRARTGSDISWTLPLNFMDAVNGTEKQILLTDGKKVKVKIPAGVVTGSKVRLAGKGNPGVAGGKAGHLIIEIEVKGHKTFKREGDDIHVNVEISVAEALQGAKVSVPTIHGDVTMKIPAGSQSGQKLRLKGKGAPNLKTKNSGNQYVHLLIKLPTDLSDKEKKEIIKIIEKHKVTEKT